MLMDLPAKWYACLLWGCLSRLGNLFLKPGQATMPVSPRELEHILAPSLPKSLAAGPRILRNWVRMGFWHLSINMYLMKSILIRCP